MHTDDFASWENPIEWWPRLIEQVLEPLARNEAASFEATRWNPEAPPRYVDIRPAEFVVLEGVTASRDAFRPFLAYTVWVDAPEAVRLQRGLDRDGETARAQWEAWMRDEEAYRLRERPDLRADAVLSGVTGAFRSTD